MRLLMVAVRDAKVEAFFRPMCYRAAGEATRDFEDTVRDEKTPMAKHPQDYDLYLIGYFDEVSGAVEPVLPAVLETGVQASGWSGELRKEG